MFWCLWFYIFLLTIVSFHLLTPCLSWHHFELWVIPLSKVCKYVDSAKVAIKSWDDPSITWQFDSGTALKPCRFTRNTPQRVSVVVVLAPGVHKPFKHRLRQCVVLAEYAHHLVKKATQQAHMLDTLLHWCGQSSMFFYLDHVADRNANKTESSCMSFRLKEKSYCEHYCPCWQLFAN